VYFLIFFLNYDNLCKILFYRKLSTSYKQLKGLVETLRVDVDVEEKNAAKKGKK